ncbi:MAG: hypothetical protein M3R38_01050 [Actinomycetota bacterium]|nr:hypothetical protein [Actinomycetota bacterium]PLS85303.1 MAG: hypothetical protein CYG60_13375 [Actinomycetota bacterium]
MADSSADKELKGYVFKNYRKQFGRCLWPGQSNCPAPVIKAHSIQRRGTLESLAEDGHVVMPDLTFKGDDPPEVRFAEVGLKVASTFTGLCSYHDNKLFEPIDDAPLDFGDREQMFLLAYRSVLKEAHASTRAANRVQGTYDKAVRLGLSDPEEVTPEMLIATDRIAAAYDRYLFKLRYDEAYLNGHFGTVEHAVLDLDAPVPSLAASTIFSMRRVGKDEAFVVLNTFPYNGHHVLVLSYFGEHGSFVEPLTSQIKTTFGRGRLKAASRLVVERCENFALRPSLYRSFTQAQRAAILNFFLLTLYDPAAGGRDDRIDLFERVP